MLRYERDSKVPLEVRDAVRRGEHIKTDTRLIEQAETIPDTFESPAVPCLR